MEIDRRRVKRLIERGRTHGRTLDRWVRSWTWLDGIGEGTQKVVGTSYQALGAPGQTIKNLMHGTALLRHPLHPALSDVPIGAWTVAVLADWLFVVTGRVPALTGDLALAVGVAGAILAALSGVTDHHDTTGLERRMATLHGMAMTAVIVLMLISLGLRLAAPSVHLSAIVLSTFGWALALTAAYLGGQLSFGMGTAVNHNAFYEGPAEFVRVGSSREFPEGEMRRVVASGMPVLIVRRLGLLSAIGAVCAHAGGPLDEGKRDGDIVTCPWHSSRFQLSDGKVVAGPATFDQPKLVVRERGGIVEVKLAQPLH